MRTCGRADRLTDSPQLPVSPIPGHFLPEQKLPSGSVSVGLSWTWPGCRQQVLSSNRFPLTVMGSWQVRCCVSGTVGTKVLIWPEQSLHLSMVYLALFFFHSFILSFIHPSILSFIHPFIHPFMHPFLRPALGTPAVCAVLC